MNALLSIRIVRNVYAVAILSCGTALAAHADEKVSALPSETPEKFTPTNVDFDYVKREEMIPMRDGVKLKTFILIPKGAQNAPILLNRTPYDAGNRVLRFNSPHLLAAVPQMDDTAVQAGYIIVFQDVRGKYGSEGDYVMNRALHGPDNPTAVDHATDCYDTIEWLVKNVPESNGHVATLGGSYEGYTTVMSTVRPQPADVRAEHHVRGPEDLREGDAEGVARAGDCERDPAAGRGVKRKAKRQRDPDRTGHTAGSS